MTLMEIYLKSLEEGITDVPFHTERSVCGQTDKAVQAVISQHKIDMMKLQEELEFLLKMGGYGGDPVDPVLQGMIRKKLSLFGYCIGLVDDYNEEPADSETVKKELHFLEDTARKQNPVSPALARLIKKKNAELRFVSQPTR